VARSATFWVACCAASRPRRSQRGTRS
jgi:hypothetical protein